jgi:hypothetical protein
VKEVMWAIEEENPHLVTLAAMVVGAMEVRVVQVLVEVMNLALVLVLVGQEDPILVGEVMGTVVVAILTQDGLMTKLCSRNCLQV